MLINKSRIPYKHILLIGMLPSFLKILIYRLKGYKIGKGVKIGIGSVIVGKNVQIGDQTKIGFFSIIRGKDVNIGRYVKIGATSIIDTERVEIDDDARISEQVFIGGISSPRAFFKLGKRTTVMQMSFINTTEPVIIGDDSGIGGHCLLFTHGSWLNQLDGFPVTFAPITLGKRVWLPWRVFIMPGVSIGDNVVIGANSLVSRNLPSNCLAAGNPARVIKENYPKKPDDHRRKAIIENIIVSFSEYLEYNSFHIQRESISSNQCKLSISKKTNKYDIHFLSSIDSIQPSGSRDLLVIDNEEKESKQDDLYGFKMKINLFSKQRIGTSDCGEEFVSFISRFGIRFNRLD